MVDGLSGKGPSSHTHKLYGGSDDLPVKPVKTEEKSRWGRSFSLKRFRIGV